MRENLVAALIVIVFGTALLWHANYSHTKHEAQLTVWKVQTVAKKAQAR